MDKSSLNESPFPKLSLDEVLELERLYQDMGEKSLDRKFFQEIAKHFSSSSNCAAKTPLSWQQVQQWFKNKEKESQDNLSDSCNLENGHKSTSSSKVKPDVDLSDLAFEARSSKDFAWHDIAMFLNHRVMSTGELEVRVRYAGFTKEQDEWVNVMEGVRERSIPLVPSECHKVKDGHHVLCFLEREDYALYCDAHVVKIERRIHDPTECRCSFIVRYIHDNTELFVGTGYAVGPHKKNLWSSQLPPVIPF
ncbi:protein SAWADEE HOMEODOMAIN HOMOLOG 1-like isoform X2 [Abrus precatorius]|uniref:Protein SAWADEE HOMEODOMAIN HOMOLOG 1-like isoform X2 n=1 Tax=Abrus precatorius TaxID=3816 RepID=A0A8B8JYV7_ABRPR|nr:protein SAWADEE HOMEODOMAIN HOMOLOG 1-like isoform X2 [Abrus precatorius]